MRKSTKVKTNTVYISECIEGMSKIADKSVDMILCDLPYGTTQSQWDAVIPFADLWQQYERVIKDNGAIVLTAAQPFTSALVMSNPKLYKYSWIWEKSKATQFMMAKSRPLCAHEDVLVFYKKQPTYNPEMTTGAAYDKGSAFRPTSSYGAQKATHPKSDGSRYPRSVQYWKTAESEGEVIHSTQKPLAMFQYLIRTYTKPGDVVLDNCLGSGTTALAALNEGRKFIGFERDPVIGVASLQRIIEAGYKVDIDPSTYDDPYVVEQLIAYMEQNPKAYRDEHKRLMRDYRDITLKVALKRLQRAVA